MAVVEEIKKVDIKKTVTSIFMVPSLKINREHLLANNFLNGYSMDETRDIPSYEDSIYLLFRPKDIDKFREFLDSEYERTRDIIEDFDHIGGFVVVVYKLDPKYKEDFNLIRRSRYSKTSPEFQALFPKVVKIQVNGLQRDEISLQVRIFKKTADLVRFWEEKFNVDLGDDIEVYEGFHIENETLTEEKLKQYME